MSNPIINDVSRRHDFVLLFDVTDGNPNGDPDAGNLPRIDPETMQGLVTDVAIKRKVRDWIDMTNDSNDARTKIYVQQGEALNSKHERAYQSLDIKSQGSKQPRDDVEKTRKWMCDNFYDIRMFGAVMTTNVNCGQVRGPLQLTIARSIDEIVPIELSITRIVVTKPEHLVVAIGEDETDDQSKRKESEMGRKALVPYGLYRAYGFFNPHFAKKTGANDDDLARFWQALQSMWDTDRSASRGMMTCRGLFIFTHESPIGNAPAHTLFERLTIARKDPDKAPRAFYDYDVSLDTHNLPEGITLTQLV